MRTINKVVGLSAVLLVAACGRDKQPAADAALTQDLKAAAAANLTLASQQAGARYAPTEITPKPAPQPATKLKREEGPKVVASPAPTIAAAPEPTVAATIEVPQTQLVETAEASTSTIDALPAVSRPVPAGSGNMGVGDGDGSVYGGGPRVIIRGGGIGDDDHCEPPGGARHPGGMGGGIGIFLPNPAGVLINRPTPTGATFPTGRASPPVSPAPRRGRGGL